MKDAKPFYVGTFMSGQEADGLYLWRRGSGSSSWMYFFFGPCNRFLSHRVRIKKYYMRLGVPGFLMRVGSSGYTGSHSLNLTGGCTSHVFYILS